MSRRRDQPTFAEMVRQPTWSEQEASTTERHAVRRLLVEGARLVHEGCGCGGRGGFPPRWFGAAEVRAVLADERATWVHDEDEGGWADVWTNAAGEVV
ncbi:hypothetical protein [Janibacter melonis]|uniref:hypothetical protein n=1 Tax=Janibacter melonis TaxID=262209 RepID=UPI00177EEDCA|nr:hypothetical protein [Janibacter melonis]